MWKRRIVEKNLGSINFMKNNMNWNFDNSYSRLSDAFKEHIGPIAVKNPELVLMNEDLVEELNLDFSKINKNELAALFTGNILPDGSNAIAQAYAGHQFGHFTMLGDGRAVLIGEHLTKNNNCLLYTSPSPRDV